MLVQGATLLPLVNVLKVGNPERERREERAARLRARRAGMAAAKRAGEPLSPVGAEGDDLVARLESGRVGIARTGALGRDGKQHSALLRALAAQRKVVDELRDAGRMSGALAERLDTELDLDAMNAAGEGARLTDGGEA